LKLILIKGYFPIADNLITVSDSLSHLKIAVATYTVASNGWYKIFTYIYDLAAIVPLLGENSNVVNSKSNLISLELLFTRTTGYDEV
jgi:hypothetical protein